MRRLSEKDFHRIYQKVPRVTVDVIIKDRRGVLLIKRSIKPDMGKWHLPGGTVNFKEILVDAVKREAKEETGLQVRIKKFLGIFEYVRMWREPGYGHVIDLVFLAEPVRGRLRGNKKAGKVLKFFKILPKNMILPKSMISTTIDEKKIFQGLIK